MNALVRHESGPQLQVAVWVAFFTACIGAVWATEPQPPNIAAPMTFQIPAQPLATALQAYGRRAGVQVLYESSSAAGRQSTALEGEFTPNEALSRLLSGTDLQVHFTRPDAITLADPSVGGVESKDDPPTNPLVKADLSIGELRVHASAPSNAIASLQDYSESVQADIQTALRKNAKTRSGNYRVVLDLWIDQARTVQRTALLQSTGDGERDTSVVTALRGLTTSRPAPTNVLQPVRVVIVVKSSQ